MHYHDSKHLIASNKPQFLADHVLVLNAGKVLGKP